jgi:hypothetical protein
VAAPEIIETHPLIEEILDEHADRREATTAASRAIADTPTAC